ncbi:MAG TPA: hypothetical protein VFK05_34830 [Polyangiaceae bacterium]|nr:hypothetical protein [Polyangiaceae bacterium]
MTGTAMTAGAESSQCRQRSTALTRTAVQLSVWALATFFAANAAASPPLGPPPPVNPFVAREGLGTQHGDTAASDTSPLAGPGIAGVSTAVIPLPALCPSLLAGADGLPLAICIQLLDQAPVIYLLDRDSGLPLASLALPKSELLSDVYPYVDAHGRVVMVVGNNVLSWIGHRRTLSGWELRVERSVSLDAAIRARCGGAACGSVVGLVPDYAGRIWFATSYGTVGVLEPSTGHIETSLLPAGEGVANSIASAPAGVAVVSDHALYLFGTDAQCKPQQRFRAVYDRGPARKPGQLSHGSGTTPTFFGPITGADYVTIVHNASPVEHLLVYAARGSGSPVCDLALPAPTGNGTEISPIAIGRTIIVTGSYGYPYPIALPEPSVPPQAAITGGITRVELDETGCHEVWTNQVRSAALPKLSRLDGSIYTIERTFLVDPSSPSPLDTYQYTVISAATGLLLFQQPVGIGTDTLELSGSIARGQVFYQGFLGGLLRISR